MAYDDDAFSRALMMAGLGMMGRGNTWDKIAQGGMFGLQAYDQALSEKEKRKLMAAKLRDEELQAKGREQAMERQQSIAAIYGGGGMPPSGSAPAGPATGAPMGGPAPMGGTPRDVGQMLLDAGFVDEAEKYGKARKSLQDEILDGVKVGVDGTPYVLTKTGKPMPLDRQFTPREKLHFADTGGRASVGFDPFTGKEASPGVEKTMSGAEKDASARGWAGVKMQREQFDRGRMVFDPERGGVVNLDTLQFRPAVQDGSPLPPKMPERQKTELLNIDKQIGQVEGALKAVKETPSAFSFNRGMATMAGTIPETLAGRRDSPDERAARAYVFNIVSAVINERAGAAQSKQELTRLRSFLPAEADNDQQIKDKLEGFKQYLADSRKAVAAPITANPPKADDVPKPASGTTVTHGGKTYRFPSAAAAEAFRKEAGIQ